MFKRSVNADDLARLKAEREAADGNYNRALTKLDQSITPPPELPHTPPLFDDQQVSTLNEQRQLIPADGPDLGAGWRGRLRGLVWTLVGPLFQQQQTFNAAIVDHVNRNVASAREGQKATVSLIGLVGGQLEALATFESCLVQFLQQLTPYVDTKDLEAAAIMRRINEDVAEVAQQLDARSRGMVGSLSGVSDELRKRWESTVVREAAVRAAGRGAPDDGRPGPARPACRAE